MTWIDYPLSVIREAVTTVMGWAFVIIITLVVGFFLGYCIGHREFMEVGTTFKALTLIFVVWLGLPQMFIAYAVTALAWYVPLRYESGWLRVSAASLNLLTWLIVVAWAVERSSHGKFWHW